MMTARLNSSATTTFSWLIRREFWENRAAWILPAAIGAFMLIVALFGKVQIAELPEHLSPDQLQLVGPMMFAGIGSAMAAMMSIYTAWYLLDCLYTERKDRSVLFWKSLPVTDSMTVLSKLAMALIVIPLVYLAVADVTALGIAFVFSVRGGSQYAAQLWNAGTWLQFQIAAVYIIITTAIWYLPFSAWLLLASAYAKRAVTLWALLVPLAVVVAEIKLLGTNNLWMMLKNHMLNYPGAAFKGESNYSMHTAFDKSVASTPKNLTEILDPVGFLTNPSTWIAIAVGAALVYAAIVLRRRSTEI